MEGGEGGIPRGGAGRRRHWEGAVANMGWWVQDA
jgi:hypothetical protein